MPLGNRAKGAASFRLCVAMPIRVLSRVEAAGSVPKFTSDPSERNDVAKDNPEIVARLSAKAEAVTKDLPAITAKRDAPAKQGANPVRRQRPPQNAQ